MVRFIPELHSSSSDLLENLHLSKLSARLLPADGPICPAVQGVEAGPGSAGVEGAALVGGLPRETPAPSPPIFQADEVIGSGGHAFPSPGVSVKLPSTPSSVQQESRPGPAPALRRQRVLSTGVTFSKDIKGQGWVKSGFED